MLVGRVRVGFGTLLLSLLVGAGCSSGDSASGQSSSAVLSSSSVSSSSDISSSSLAADTAEVSLVFPPDGASLSGVSGNIILRGKIKSIMNTPAQFSVKVNGVDAEVDGDNWHFEYSVSPGDLTLNVDVLDGERVAAQRQWSINNNPLLGKDFFSSPESGLLGLDLLGERIYRFAPEADTKELLFDLNASTSLDGLCTEIATFHWLERDGRLTLLCLDDNNAPYLGRAVILKAQASGGWAVETSIDVDALTFVAFDQNRYVLLRGNNDTLLAIDTETSEYLNIAFDFENTTSFSLNNIYPADGVVYFRLSYSDNEHYRLDYQNLFSLYPNSSGQSIAATATAVDLKFDVNRSNELLEQEGFYFYIGEDALMMLRGDLSIAEATAINSDVTNDINIDRWTPSDLQLLNIVGLKNDTTLYVFNSVSSTLYEVILASGVSRRVWSGSEIGDFEEVFLDNNADRLLLIDPERFESKTVGIDNEIYSVLDFQSVATQSEKYNNYSLMDYATESNFVYFTSQNFLGPVSDYDAPVISHIDLNQGRVVDDVSIFSAFETMGLFFEDVQYVIQGKPHYYDGELYFVLSRELSSNSDESTVNLLKYRPENNSVDLLAVFPISELGISEFYSTWTIMFSGENILMSAENGMTIRILDKDGNKIRVITLSESGANMPTLSSDKSIMYYARRHYTASNSVLVGSEFKLYNFLENTVRALPGLGVPLIGWPILKEDSKRGLLYTLASGRLIAVDIATGNRAAIKVMQ